MDCSTPFLSIITSRAWSNSGPSGQWCYPTISSSAVLISSCLQSFPASGSFPMSPLFAFPGGSHGKESACNVRDPDSIPRLGRSPGEGKVVNEARFLGWGRGSWKLWGVCLLLQLGLVSDPGFPPMCEPYLIKRLTGSFSHTQVSTSTSHQHMVKNLPTVQETPRFDPWVRKIPWRKEWQPTPVLLPGEFHGQRTWWTTVYVMAKSRTQLCD